MDRRSFLSASATVALLPLAEAPAFALTTKPGSGDAKLNALFEEIFHERVRTSPELATSLGLDKGPNGDLKSKLETDPVPVQRRKDLGQAGVDREWCEHDRLTTVDRRLRDSHRTAHARAAQATVATGILREILLVVILSLVELRRGNDFRRNPTVAGPIELFLKHVARCFRGVVLRFVVVVDAGSILSPDVVALSHSLCRVVILPECFQQVVI